MGWFSGCHSWRGVEAMAQGLAGRWSPAGWTLTLLGFAIGLAAPAARADLPPEIVKRVEAAALDLVRGRTADAHEKLQPLLELGAQAQQKDFDALLNRY